jgi:hypothetical protein
MSSDEGDGSKGEVTVSDSGSAESEEKSGCSEDESEAGPESEEVEGEDFGQGEESVTEGEMSVSQ